MSEYRAYVTETIRASSIDEHLATREAVVLERLARGGGATDWYLCRGMGDLGFVIDRIRPGSVVSFYFDGRIRRVSDRGELNDIVGDAIRRTGECVIAVLSGDGCSMEVDFVRSHVQLQMFLDEHPLAATIFAGEFPARENSPGAVTITVPDADGVVRAHPH